MPSSKLSNTLLASAVAASLSLLSASTLADPLTFDVYNAGPSSFHVNATLIVGESEAMLIDTGFTKADGLRLVAKVLDSGKPLNTIFISQADPDYYFGAEVLKQYFPNARVITTPTVRKAIEKKMAAKVAYWSPILGGNAPGQPLLPDAYNGDSLTLDGHTIEIRGTEGVLANRPYLWVADNKALLGNIAVFSGLHVWTADTQSQAQLDAWSQQLDTMKALQPELVVPGHMAANTELTASAIDYTQGYLADFRQALKQHDNSADVKAEMQQKYPNAGLGIALELGSKVHTGEMKW